jgi:hypothetical protein
MTASLRMLIRIAREVVGDRCLIAGNPSLSMDGRAGSPSAAEDAGPLKSTFRARGGEKPMSAYEYYDHDKLKAGA